MTLRYFDRVLFLVVGGQCTVNMVLEFLILIDSSAATTIPLGTLGVDENTSNSLSQF